MSKKRMRQPLIISAIGLVLVLLGQNFIAGTLSEDNYFPIIVGEENSYLMGFFGPVFDWPIIPIHMSVLPDGRLYTFGTNTKGKQGSKYDFVVWNPQKGLGGDSFELVTNIKESNTDVFCAAQSFVAATGQPILFGGDQILSEKRNSAVNDVNIFSPKNNQLYKVKPMAYDRWYATAVMLRNGDHLLLGGRGDQVSPMTGDVDDLVEDAADPIPRTFTYTSIPEVRDSKTGEWRTLTNAVDPNGVAYGGVTSYYYPKAYLRPTGQVLIIGNGGGIYEVNPSLLGTLTQLIPSIKLPKTRPSLPSIYYRPNRVLTLRNNKTNFSVNISQNNTDSNSVPVVQLASPSQLRYYGNLTVMADGSVFYNGGSTFQNNHPDHAMGAHLDSEIFYPSLNTWRAGAAASRPRLYHSTAILLPDGSVLTGGGGAPGPTNELNAEIFYPPYLFENNKSGRLNSNRPEILSGPSTVLPKSLFSIESDVSVVSASLIRLGATTHNFNNETRYFRLLAKKSEFVSDRWVSEFETPSGKVAPGGYYMLFVFQQGNRTPSRAKIIKLEI